MKRRRNPYLTVDAVIFIDQQVVLIKRKKDPFKGQFALPGGFVEWGERVEDACRREAREETGLTIELLELLGVFSDPERDPRGHVCSVAYLAKKIKGDLTAASDAKAAERVPIRKIRGKKIKLAFDHQKILSRALKS